jgi:mono/diheme cytochrome c family protein
MKNVLRVLFIAGAGVVTLSAESQEDELSKSMARGKVVYEELCVTCHLADGKGIPSVFPPLAGADYLMKNQKESIRAIKFGQQGEITVNGTTYNNVMAPQGLSDAEIADVMNYILNSWGNKGKMVTVEEVGKVK